MDVATISRRHVAAVMLVILGWAAAAHAEDATLPPANVVGLAGAYALYARAAVFSLPFVWLSCARREARRWNRCSDANPSRRFAAARFRGPL